jgi:hypothetical protein
MRGESICCLVGTKEGLLSLILIVLNLAESLTAFASLLSLIALATAA